MGSPGAGAGQLTLRRASTIRMVLDPGTPKNFDTPRSRVRSHAIDDISSHRVGRLSRLRVNWLISIRPRSIPSRQTYRKVP